MARCAQRRFRRDPDAYLATLEAVPFKGELPARVGSAPSGHSLAVPPTRPVRLLAESTEPVDIFVPHITTDGRYPATQSAARVEMGKRQAFFARALLLTMGQASPAAWNRPSRCPSQDGT